MSYQEQRGKLLSFYVRNRRMPGYQELMALMGFSSKNAAYKLINRFVEDGVLKKDAKGRIAPGATLRGARILGVVEAGFPSPAEEELLDVMDLDEYLVPNKEIAYLLKVKGDSMVEAGICPGDMVIVERRQAYKPGQIVIANVDGEYTMKYLRRERNRYYLEPANAKYAPIYPAEGLAIEAVVTGVVRKY